MIMRTIPNFTFSPQSVAVYPGKVAASEAALADSGGAGSSRRGGYGNGRICNLLAAAL